MPHLQNVYIKLHRTYAGAIISCLMQERNVVLGPSKVNKKEKNEN